jgi:hypothetical protein
MWLGGFGFGRRAVESLFSMVVNIQNPVFLRGTVNAEK